MDCYNNIPNCDCEHGIYYSTHSSWLCFSDFDCFYWIWFFLFQLLIAVGFFAWVRFKVSLGLENVQFCNCSNAISTWNFDFDSELGLGLESSTGTRIFNWDPHICRYCQNTFFYNCRTRKQLLIIVLYHQSYIVFWCD